MKSILFAFAFSWLLIQCAPAPEYRTDQITGSWDCYKLEREGESITPSPGEIMFKFAEDGYEYKGYSFREEGSWKVEGTYLITQVEGLLEKKVDIQKLKNDTMILDMVDNGVPMKMHLLKK